METVPLDEAWVLHPTALATDAEGSLYFVNQGALRFRKVDRWGRVSTVAGSGLLGYSGDGGPATEAALNEPYAVTDDDVGNHYVADSKNRIVRKVVLDGTISTAAGRVPFGLPTEIRFHVPQEAEPGQTRVIVLHDGALSEPFAVQVGRIAPGCSRRTVTAEALQPARPNGGRGAEPALRRRSTATIPRRGVTPPFLWTCGRASVRST